MTAFTCKIYITEFFPGNIKTGKIEVKQNSEIIFIGIYIMNIATVYRENLSLIYSYILMSRNQIYMTFKAVDEFQFVFVIMWFRMCYIA